MAALLYLRDSLTNGSAGGNSTGKKIDLSKLPHDDLGPQLNYTIWLLTMLAAGFLGLRVYCKLIRHRGLWWDDHVLIVSWVREHLDVVEKASLPFLTQNLGRTCGSNSAGELQHHAGLRQAHLGLGQE